MEINIDIDKLRKEALVIATPMYGGNSTAAFTNSLVNTFYKSGLYNLDVSFFTLYNDALITRARNKLVKKFLTETTANFFLFIDSDIQFNYMDIFAMMQIMSESEDKKIICATYPKKEIDWDQIHGAYQAEQIKKPEDIKLFSSKFVFNFKEPNKSYVFSLDEPLAVKESGTGFMMIHREVFEKFAEAYPEQNSIEPGLSEELFYYFDCKIDPETKYYLSEDYMFCEWAEKIGYDTWILPWVHLGHMGSYIYQGSFAETSRLNYLSMNAQGDDNDK